MAHEDQNETPLYGRPVEVPKDGFEDDVNYVVEGDQPPLVTGSALEDDLLSDFADSHDDLVKDIFLKITGRAGKRAWFLRYRPVVNDPMVKQYQRIARSGKSSGNTVEDVNTLRANAFLLKTTNTGIFVDGLDEAHQLRNESGRETVIADPWFLKKVGKRTVDEVLKHILGDTQINTHAKAVLLAAGLTDQADPITEADIEALEQRVETDLQRAAANGWNSDGRFCQGTSWPPSP